MLSQRAEEMNWDESKVSAEETHLSRQMEDMMKEDARRWATRTPVRFDTRPSRDGAIYEVEHRLDEALVWIQTGTQFTDRFYDDSSNDEVPRSLNEAMEVLLGAMGYAEVMDCREDHTRKEMWDSARLDISARIRDFVDAYEAALGFLDEIPRG